MPLATLALLLALASPAPAPHGGVFPPVTNPPNDGGTSTGGASTPGGAYPTAPPAPGGPGAPSPPGPAGSSGGEAARGPAAGPKTGGPAMPRAGPMTGGPRPAGAGPMTGAMPTAEPSGWQPWWENNRDRFLPLKRRIHAPAGPSTRGDDGADQRSLGPTREQRSHVLLALVERIRLERQPDIVSGAMVAAAKIGAAPGSPAAQALEQALLARVDDPSQEVSESAAVALGILGHESSLEPLLALLADDERGRRLTGGRPVSPRTRAFAAYALGLIAERATANRTRQMVARGLVAVLASESAASSDLEVAAVSALGLARPDPAPEGAEASADWVSREGAARLASRLLEDERRRDLLRAHAAVALGRLGLGAPDALREQGAASLVVLARQPKRLPNGALQGVALALGELGDDDRSRVDLDVRASLERLASGGDLHARGFALVSLGAVGGRPGAGEGREDAVRGVRHTLLNELRRGTSRTRTWAALALGVMERARLDAGAGPSSDVRELLREMLRDRSSTEECGAYAVACGLARDGDAAPVLLAKLAGCREDETRGYCALALGMIEAAEAVGPLRAVVADARFRPWLLRQASIGLALLGDKELVPELAGRLREAQGLATQASLAAALGATGDARALPQLLELLADPRASASARGFAAVALGGICDEREFPWSASYSAGANYVSAPATLSSGDGMGLLEIL